VSNSCHKQSLAAKDIEFQEKNKQCRNTCDCKDYGAAFQLLQRISTQPTIEFYTAITRIVS
jgi:hypothetical protein